MPHKHLISVAIFFFFFRRNWRFDCHSQISCWIRETLHLRHFILFYWYFIAVSQDVFSNIHLPACKLQDFFFSQNGGLQKMCKELRHRHLHANYVTELWQWRHGCCITLMEEKCTTNIIYNLWFWSVFYCRDTEVDLHTKPLYLFLHTFSWLNHLLHQTRTVKNSHIEILQIFDPN
jgi:hypothetical protein